ncbi:PXDN protein, partial [Pseudoatta argentina]
SFSVQLLNTQSANFFRVTDTLSLGDRTIDNMDRHAIQTRPRQQMLDHSSGPKSKPEPTFDFTQHSNVTALIGKTAYLTCRVRNLGNKTVSWVRHRDIHILTAGAYTYTSDQRFQALHRQNTGHGNEWSDWTLCIKWAQERDQGIYECQISTIPIKSYQFHLNVVVPTATILGGPELYVGAGSTINLTCAIRFSSEPPAYIFWYYNENVLSYDSPRGGVSVITEKGGDVTTSWLLIQTAQPSDSGEYSCKPSNANTASIRVHVLNVFISTPVYLPLSCCLTFRKHPQFLSQFARDSQIGCDQSLYTHPLVDARLNETQRDIPLHETPKKRTHEMPRCFVNPAGKVLMFQTRWGHGNSPNAPQRRAASSECVDVTRNTTAKIVT